MKRVLATGLIIVFLFNVIGYYGIYVAMLRQAHITMNQQIDNEEYQADQTVTIKIPLTLPYPVQQDSFERVQGDFEHHGEFYKLVKQKYLNDTLYVVCIKNIEEKKAFKVFSDLVKLSTDQSSAPTNQNLKTLASIIKDYSPVAFEIHLTPPASIDLAKSFTSLTFNILSQDHQVFSPPPKLSC